ncbi:hypothetical protein JCM6882_006263 [Rhodosporidiobolus microsporus]
MASVGSHPSPPRPRPKSILKRARSSHAPGLVRLRGGVGTSHGMAAGSRLGSGTRGRKRVRWASPVDDSDREEGTEATEEGEKGKGTSKAPDVGVKHEASPPPVPAPPLSLSMPAKCPLSPSLSPQPPSKVPWLLPPPSALPHAPPPPPLPLPFSLPMHSIVPTPSPTPTSPPFPHASTSKPSPPLLPPPGLPLALPSASTTLTPTPTSPPPTPPSPPPPFLHTSTSKPPVLAPPAEDEGGDMDEGANEEFYRVERILAEEKRGRRREKWYLVKWAGYPVEEATWEPREHLSEAEALDVWIREKREKKRRRTV